MFVPASKLAFPAKKLKSQKQEQTTNFSTGLWNAEKQASTKMNKKQKSSSKAAF
jgi:hypothetical protein